MKIAICGDGGCGKDSFATMLDMHSGGKLKFRQSSSAFAAQIVYATWGHEFYSSIEACHADRRNHRERWRDIIADYHKEDPLKLYRELLKDQDILVRVCRKVDMQAIKAANMVDLWVWVHRPVINYDPTQEFGYEECDIVVLNWADLPALEGKAKALARVLVGC
jgi:hypothetical protein